MLSGIIAILIHRVHRVFEHFTISYMCTFPNLLSQPWREMIVDEECLSVLQRYSFPLPGISV